MISAKQTPEQPWSLCGVNTQICNGKAWDIRQLFHSSQDLMYILCIISSFFDGTVFQWAYLTAVGVSSAQMKMLKWLTAQEENRPMIEEASNP